MASSILRYFNLQSGVRRIVSEGVPTGTGDSPMAPVLPQYVAATLGVIAEPFLRHYTSVGSWQVDWAGFAGRVIFGVVIGILLLPAVYKSAFDPQKPILVQLAAIFTIGIGWQSIVASSAKVITGQ